VARFLSLFPSVFFRAGHRTTTPRRDREENCSALPKVALPQMGKALPVWTRVGHRFASGVPLLTQSGTSPGEEEKETGARAWETS
jgi:hypothetical protein